MYSITELAQILIFVVDDLSYLYIYHLYCDRLFIFKTRKVCLEFISPPELLIANKQYTLT